MSDDLETGASGRAGLLYHDLAEQLSERIRSGELPSGSRLPAEREFAESHGVSRVTLRQALALLEREGLIERRRGSGTYVSRRVSQPLSVLTSFSEDLAARGMTGQSELIKSGTGIATPEEVISLGLAPGHAVGRIVRLRSAEGEPLALESTTIPKDVLPDVGVVGESLYRAMDEVGMRPVRAVQRLTAVALDQRLAELLKCEPGSPGLQIVRIGYTADRRAVEYTCSTFRGDRWDFVTELS